MPAPRLIPFLFVLCALFGPNTRAIAEDTGRIEGIVVDAATSIGLRRAHVVLRPAASGNPAIGVETDDRGHFEIRDIAPGRYSLLAERDGFLSGTVARVGAYRLPEQLTVRGASNLTNVEMRLSKWATIDGRIRYDDAEPASSILVQAWREQTWRGRHGYFVAGAARTTDQGRFRIHGLAPGAYIVAAVYDRTIQVPNLKEQPRLDASGQPIPPEGYATTFYPHSTKLTDAAPLKLTHGSEIEGIDIFLNPVRKLNISGEVIDGVAGTILKSPPLTLERLDGSGSGGIPVQVPLLTDGTGKFELRGVPPGQYLLTCEGMSAVSESKTGPIRIAARLPITIGNADVDNLKVVMRAAEPWLVTLQSDLDNEERKVRIVFEPRSVRGQTIRENYTRGMKMSLLPDEIYDITVDYVPDDYYLKSVKLNNQEVAAINGSASATSIPLVIQLSRKGGRVFGRVSTQSGDLLTGANVTLIPQSGKLADYRETSADENAYFTLRGVPPGKYTLVAWLDEPACDIWRRSACEATGQEVTVEEATQANVALVYKPPA